MATNEKEQELIKGLQDTVINFKIDDAKRLAEEAVQVGADAYTMTMEGLAGGMEVVSEKFDNHEYFVPETLLCAKALYAALDILKPHIKSTGTEAKGQVVLGVMQGDVHDLGKNLIKAIFESAGWSVHDLGRDVPIQKFVDEQLRTDSDIVMLSAMMTTSMVGMKKLIPRIKEKNPKVKIMIGGAPISEKTVEEYGADSTADNAPNALQEAMTMLETLRVM
ncbi:MAG: cobalamin-dependent protein [Desulfobacterales bacterium]|jgi:corrinoid protein of di/trimethylamine methyltransferase|nr:cobalamin-dependent protein [Desulfobacterales bacterium]MDP6808691.1 cobalamin-dependent protein [Desulfobacterales bacterium]|tara:strand:- start:15746 stop:16408 length:663 start_codon:yes stop_codon:yes gene_type:complete